MRKHSSWSPSLYREIFVEDTYRLRRFRKEVATFYDIGANLGCIAAFARSMWLNSVVVSVEPHPDNFAVLKEVAGWLGGVSCVQAALGRGPVCWVPAIGGSDNPGGHTYVSECVGYDSGDLETIGLSDCRSVTLAEVFREYPPGGPYVVKIDCEGGEECLFDDAESNEVLRGADYWAAELHFFSARAREIPEVDRLSPGLLGTHGHVIRACLDWCYGFSDTHVVELELAPNSGMVWCIKK